jgi:hypothetical protein
MTTPDEQFIPPDPNEPLPPATGASDADAGGELVTEIHDAAALDDEGGPVAPLLAAAATGAPTWAAVYALAKRQIAKWAPGRLRENVNDYTQWYYGNNTAAQFCFIFISWVLAHAAKTQAAGLALLGGKKAYVPYIRNISGYNAGHSGVKVGAIAAVSSFNHIGFVVRVGSTTFDLLSGNSVNGSSDDAVTVKTYSLSSISGYVNLKYAAAPPPKPIPATAPSGSPVLKVGSTGSRVTQLQKAVNTTRTKKITVDSEYGSQTAKAVSEFQSHHGLKADGEYGTKTAAALKKVTG